MRELLRELRNMGKTILLSSHILTELAELCDAIGVLETGQLIASGPLEEIHQRVSSTRVFRLRLLSDRQEAEKLLRQDPLVSDITHPLAPGDPQRETLLDVAFTGDDSAAALLLENLVSARVRLAAFSETATNLEEIYLQLTKGEVA